LQLRKNIFGLIVLCSTSRVFAAPVERVIDDFEKGTGDWTTNDKNQETGEGAANLADVVATPPGNGGPNGSEGAALFTFKAAQNSWASASRRVTGSSWAKIGAQRLSFWINGGGNESGVDLILRGTYKNAAGQNADVAFTLPGPIRLRDKTWRRVVIPLSDFKASDNGPLASRLDGVYLLQFAQRQSWDSRFFLIDELKIEGSGQPIPQKDAPPVEPPATQPSVNAETAPAGAIAVNVDFLRVVAKLRPAANISVGAGEDTRAPINASANFRRAVRTLDPKFVRLDAGVLSDLVDSARPAFDFTRLQNAVQQTRAIGRLPFIAITNPPEWGLSERAYALFASQGARAANQATSKFENYYELLPSAPGLTDAQVVSFYNRARGALKSLSKDYRVGGVGQSGDDGDLLRAFLKDASGLEFLSLQFYGATEGAPETDKLFESARGVASIRAAAALLDRSGFRSAPIFVTQSNLSGARGDNDIPTDERVSSMTSASWWATYLASASRLTDQIFHNDAAAPAWGLLDANVNAYPAYYVMYLWNTYCAPGSERVEVKVANDAIEAIAVNTPTAHNLMLSNTTGSEVTAQVGIRGFPVLRHARMHVYDDPRQTVRMQPLPTSAFQTVRLKPFSVTVVQFIEPPKGG